jgi:tRNA U38,U39,U40 pseudouridine synthase TruA
LFQALKKVSLIENIEDSMYTRCGRTDSGVSAYGQVRRRRLGVDVDAMPCRTGCDVVDVAWLSQVLTLRLRSSARCRGAFDKKSKTTLAEDEVPLLHRFCCLSL